MEVVGKIVQQQRNRAGRYHGIVPPAISQHCPHNTVEILTPRSSCSPAHASTAANRLSLCVRMHWGVQAAACGRRSLPPRRCGSDGSTWRCLCRLCVSAERRGWGGGGGEDGGCGPYVLLDCDDDTDRIPSDKSSPAGEDAAERVASRHRRQLPRMHIDCCGQTHAGCIRPMRLHGCRCSARLLYIAPPPPIHISFSRN